MTNKHRSKLPFMALALAFLLPACAPDTDEPVEQDFDTGDPMAETEADERYDDPYRDGMTTDDRDDASVRLTIQQSEAYGEYLVRADGRPLYLFTADTRGESSACYDACAEAWPPVSGEGDAAVAAGLDASLVGTITRADGSVQATYNGWPLYEFVRDSGTEPTGQDIESFGGEWYLISPDGEEIHAE